MKPQIAYMIEQYKHEAEVSIRQKGDNEADRLVIEKMDSLLEFLEFDNQVNEENLF